jgi:hypothetical protein
MGKVGEPATIELHPTIENLEQQVCPSDRYGRAQYRHVLYTAQLLHEAQEQGCDFGRLDFSELFQSAAYHHQRYPDTLDDCLLKKADWLASGHDRREVESDDPKAHVVTGLWPILASLAWPELKAAAVPAEQRRNVPTGTLSFSEAASLPRIAQDRATYRAGCRQVWEMLRQGVGGTYRDPADYVEHLATLAQRALHAIWPRADLASTSALRGASTSSLSGYNRGRRRLLRVNPNDRRHPHLVRHRARRPFGR